MARSLGVSLAFALVLAAAACGDSTSVPSSGAPSSAGGSSSGQGSGGSSGTGSGSASGGGTSGGGSGGSGGSTSGGSAGGSSGSSGTPTGGSNGGSSGGSDGGGGGGGDDGGGADGEGGAGYACTLILGVSASGEWINQGGFFAAVADGTRWEAITKEHEYVQLWADPDDPVWSQQFDPPPPSPQSASHSCAAQATMPDRVIFIGYTDPTDPTYQSEAAWETVLTQVVGTIRMKFPSVRRIELMTMIRGPISQGGMTYPGGFNCDTDLMEDVVQPYVDDAIQAVAAQNPSTVVAAPKFYVGDCSWWCTDGSGTGPHFVCASGATGCTDGRPDLAAKMIADSYDTQP